MAIRPLLITMLILFLSGGNALAQVVWSDEFEAPQIDRSKWTYDVGGHGFGNGQLEYNTARPENSYIKDGSLVIEARREDYFGNSFTSARMSTQGRFAFQYGVLEARIKVPDPANGIWPAFWMLGINFPAVQWPDCGEIDILEIGGKDGIANGLQRRRINNALHFSGPDGSKASLVNWIDADVDLNRDFHVYRLSWTPSELEFFLDDSKLGRWDIRGPGRREFHQPYFPILNVAVGSWADSYTGVTSPDQVTATFPSRMHVDWIRVKRNEHTRLVIATGSEQSGPFGVFTERANVANSLEFTDPSDPEFNYGSGAALFTWNNMTARTTPMEAAEGDASWSFDLAAGQWFGMGVLTPSFRDMRNYSDGNLHFSIKTTSTIPMRVGIKSSRGGEAFLPLGDEDWEFGFARDGNWHRVRVPINRFANIDFATVHQFFMIAGDAPTTDTTLSVDDVWWEPGQSPPRPVGGSFGVFTEDDDHKTAGEFVLGKDGNFFIWENTLRESDGSSFEGRNARSLSSAPGSNWFGAAFTPDVKYDLRHFGRPGGKLHFAMKTTSRAVFRIGLKSGNVDGIGQKWFTFDPEKDPFGFARDGEWHVIEIPMKDFETEVDLSAVSQLFQLLGTEGPTTEIMFDDVCFMVE